MSPPTATPTPGILLVTMAPHPSLPPAQFHDWYNNEHGPGRLRLPFVENGFRYRASSSSSPPGWLAVYDIADMAHLASEPYTRLRAAPVQSPRERATMRQIDVDRRFWDLVREWRGGAFVPLEGVGGGGGEAGNVMVCVRFAPREGGEEALAAWVDGEHVPAVERVGGWRRSRRFVTSYLDVAAGRERQGLVLHEFAAGAEGLAELGGALAAMAREATSWVGELAYTFGPAPRDLGVLCDGAAEEFVATDGRTRTLPSRVAGRPVIESYVAAADGTALPYTLTCAPSAAADAKETKTKTLICANSILTRSPIWSAFLAPFLAAGYTAVTFDARGCSKPSPSAAGVTVDTLADDLVALMDALRVPSAYLVGVSLGGATVLNTALRHPDRVAAFVACDTNAVAPAGNAKAWGERIGIAEAEGRRDGQGEAVVGRELADVTVKRWFTEASFAETAEAGLRARVEEVRGMVEGNSLEGFRSTVRALYEYDFRARMRAYKGKGAFLVGAQDGVLPKTMKEMAASLGEEGTVLGTIEGAGHLPMVERPAETAEWVLGFFEGK